MESQRQGPLKWGQKEVGVHKLQQCRVEPCLSTGERRRMAVLVVACSVLLFLIHSGCNVTTVPTSTLDSDR